MKKRTLIVCTILLSMAVATGCSAKQENSGSSNTESVTEKISQEEKTDEEEITDKIEKPDQTAAESESENKTDAEKTETDKEKGITKTAGKESEKESEKETEKETKKEMGKETEKETEDESEEGKEAETEEDFWNGHIVGIDPGHQGSWVDMSAPEPDAPGSSNYKAKSTTGTMGRYTGVPEYQLNLDISLALRDELEERGYEVVMTREDNDTAISNIERAQKAAEGGSEIYVRIHANGSDDPSVNGALAMTPSPQNPYVGDLAEDSFRLSQFILNDYCTATGFANLGVQYYDNMTGINWSSVPVMILEMGFMTNESDDYAMQDSAMQVKMVDGIANGIDEYFGLDSSRPGRSVSAGDRVQDDLIEDSKTKDSDTKKSDTEEIEEMEPEGIAADIYEIFLRTRETAGEKWAVALEDLTTKETWQYHGSVRMQSASVIKVFIMGAVYDRMCYPSSPEREIIFGESYSGELRGMLEEMITVSSNEAANELITRLGEGDFSRGAAVVNEFCMENGYTGTSVGRRFLETNPTGDNYTTALDCLKILSDIYKGTCVGPEASEKMLTILRGQTNRSKIPAGLPEDIQTANKTGEMPEGYNLGCIENDMAVIFTEKGDYVLTVLSNDLAGKNEEAKQLISQISAYVYDLFSE